MSNTKEIIKEALSLKPVEKAKLVDQVLSSLDNSDIEIDELWAKEAESRIDAYDKDKLRATSLAKILEKYK